MKISFYIVSLWLLSILIIILTLDFAAIMSGNISVAVMKNILPIGSFVLFLIGICLVFRLKYIWKGTENPPYKIVSIKNENYEYLTFLTTYIIPLICIDLNSIRFVIVLIILLVIIGFIFIKMDLYYGNPTLALLGYRIYRIGVEPEKQGNNTDIIVISKDKLHIGSSITWIEIDETTWVVRETK